MLRAENPKTAHQSGVRAETVSNEMASCWKSSREDVPIRWLRAEKWQLFVLKASVIKNSTCWKCHQKQHVLKMSIVKK